MRMPHIFAAVLVALMATGCASMPQTRAEQNAEWRMLGLQPPPYGYRYQGCRQYHDGFRGCRLVADPWRSRGRSSFRLSI